jgi:hypothetical protein
MQMNLELNNHRYVTATKSHANLSDVKPIIVVSAELNRE